MISSILRLICVIHTTFPSLHLPSPLRWIMGSLHSVVASWFLLLWHCSSSTRTVSVRDRMMIIVKMICQSHLACRKAVAGVIDPHTLPSYPLLHTIFQFPHILLSPSTLSLTLLLTPFPHTLPSHPPPHTTHRPWYLSMRRRTFWSTG